MSYYTDIKVYIKEIGTAKIIFNQNTKDYSFNGKVPREIPVNYFTQLNELFESSFSIFVRQNCTVDSLNKLVTLTIKVIKDLNNSGDMHRGHFVFARSKNKLSEEAFSTHDDINAIISTQKLVLNKVLLKLYEKLDVLKASAPSSLVNNDDNETESFKATDSSNIPFSSAGRASFKLSKKMALMLIFLLEKHNIIEFENNLQKIKFIENNFNYTEVRKKHTKFNELCVMKGTGKEFTNFQSNIDKDIESNNDTLNDLQDKLNEAILKYEFEVRKYKKEE